jgi:hypothetical protein
MSEERDLACTRCGRLVHIIGGDWIDPDLYECQPCKRGEGPVQTSLLPEREEWHATEYDPTMSRIPF